MSRRRRSREMIRLGSVLATVSRIKPNVTRIEVHATTPEEADAALHALAERIADGDPTVALGLEPETDETEPGVDQRMELRSMVRKADPDCVDDLDDEPGASDAACHGDSDGSDPNAG